MRFPRWDQAPRLALDPAPRVSELVALGLQVLELKGEWQVRVRVCAVDARACNSALVGGEGQAGSCAVGHLLGTRDHVPTGRWSAPPLEPCTRVVPASV